MILDKIENMSHYITSPAWMQAMTFLQNLKADIADGEYEIDGSEIFARVMTYSTKKIEDAYPEAHRKYIDIQAVLSGEEMVAWYPLKDLQERVEYDAESDVVFYDRQTVMPSSSILSEGLFMAFFPEDAHMPSISSGQRACTVKKVVIKIAVECIR